MKKIFYSSFISVLLLCSSMYGADGDLDLSFNTSGKVITPIGSGHDNAHSIALQNDGKIIVAGDYYETRSSFALARYNSNGTLDTSFDSDGIVTTDVSIIDYGYSIAIQNDGKIILAGSSYIAANYDIAVLRYNSNGSLDASFDTDGIVTTSVGTETDTARNVVIQADGKIVVAGDSRSGSDQDFTLLRYNSNGTLDSSFNGSGKVSIDLGGENEECYGVAIDKNGKIVVAGTSGENFALARFNSNGTLDSSFSTDGKVITDINSSNSYDYAQGLAIQGDGKILVAGTSNEAIAVVRYNTDGTLDSSFGNNGIVETIIGNYYSNGYSVAVQSDGKIIVAGQSNNDSYNHDFALVRYNRNGSLDESFGIEGKVITDVGNINHNDEGYSAVMQRDGNIIVAGASDNGTNIDFALVRYIAHPLIMAPVISYLLD